MKKEEYLTLLEEIQKHYTGNSRANIKNRKVKFVRSVYDTRDGTIKEIAIREFYTDKARVFTNPTLEGVMKWLAM